MLPALLPLLLFAPPTGTAISANVAVASHPAPAERTVQQRQDDGFVIVDRDPARPAPATVTLGASVGIDLALVEGRGFPCGGTGR